MQDYEKQDSTNIFKAADFFMIRCPLLSINIYNEVFNQKLLPEDIERKVFELANENIIKEPITIASLSLNESLSLLNFEKEPKKRKQVLNSLLKYIIRITTRTTPYGIFSGVMLGEFTKNTNVTLNNINKHVKRARPDMEWIYAVIRKIENDEQILNELFVKANDLAVVNGSRLNIGYISNYGQTLKDISDDTLTSSIRNSTQVQFVMNMTKEPIKYGELISKIKLNNPNVSIDRIKQFLNQLQKSEYIITELRPPLINTLPFEYIVSKLERIKSAEEIYLKLLEIMRLIDKYNASPIGEGEPILKETIISMKNLKECKDYLQVDLRLKENKAELNSKVAEELENTSMMLLKLANGIHQPYYLEKYMADFIEKYGTNREVPVIELLDNDFGLGAPASYDKPQSPRVIDGVPNYEDEKKIHNYLLNKVISGLVNNKTEINITDDDIVNLKLKKVSEYSLDELPKSFEFNVLIAAENSKAIDNDDYSIFIGPNIGSNRAGKTFGRFMDILPESTNSKLSKYNHYENKMTEDDTIFAELVELPQSGRISNISINTSQQEYELTISTNYSGKKENLSISDLYVGVSRGNRRKFYIKSKSLDKKVILETNHMLNMISGSNIYRFLREVSAYYTINIFDMLYMNGLSELSYVPRIRYGKVVLFPSTWRLTKFMLNKELSSNEGDFYNEVKTWRSKWKVPKFVYLKEADNRLLLNLENQLHLDLINHMIQTNVDKVLTFTELEGEFGQVWVEGECGKYCSEMVVPISINPQFIEKVKKVSGHPKQVEVLETKSDYKSNAIDINTFDKSRYFFLGDEWLYFKLYGNSKRIDEFIAYEMLPFCESLVKNGYIEKFFFIRYSDPDIHIRLRLKVSKEHLSSYAIPKLNEWFHRLMEAGLLTRVTFDTYYRETERYGGNELINLAEEVFYTDSIFVSNIIMLKRSGQLDLDMKFISVASIISLMEELKIEYDSQKEIFENLCDKNSFRKLFQKDRETFLKVSNSSNDWSSLEQIEGGPIIKQLFEIRKTSLNNFANEMNCLDKQNRLCNSKLEIILSLIHMFCNRLNGASDFEQTVMGLVRHSLQSLEYIKKHSI